MALNRGDLPVLVARRPFRKFCRQRAGAPELKECYVNGTRTLLHSLANNMNVDMVGGTIYETLFIMFGPGGASGPYTLVMSERCIPCERILCERYTNGAALLLSLANNMNVYMGDIRSQHFRNVVYHVWARWCIRPIHASYVGAVHSM